MREEEEVATPSSSAPSVRRTNTIRGLAATALIVWLIYAWLSERNGRGAIDGAYSKCIHDREMEVKSLETKLDLQRSERESESARLASECRRELEDAKRAIVTTTTDLNEKLSKRETDYLAKASIAKRDRDRQRRFATDLARRHLETKYGATPVRLLMETSEGNMTLEMAPSSLMPVATSYFLNQVERGLWDGRAFFRAERHVIQASDMCGACDPHEGEKRGPHQDGLPFQEYSPEYPHEIYTMG